MKDNYPLCEIGLFSELNMASIEAIAKSTKVLTRGLAAVLKSSYLSM